VLALTVLLSALLIPLVPAEAQLQPEIVLLSKIREHVKRELAASENYTCVETIARSGRKTADGPIALIDTVRFEVARTAGKELFSFPGERRFTERPLGELVNVGLSVEGLFGAFAHELFNSSVPTILPAGQSNIAGRTIVEYHFKFPTLMSHYTLTTGTGSAQVGWSGSFWADAESLELTKLRVDADDIPVEMGIRSAVTEIEYGKYQMESATLQLPQTATVTMAYWNGAVSANQTDFSQCRVFSVATNLSFDEASAGEPSGDEPLAGAVITPAPALVPEAPLSPLPDGLTIHLRLDKPVEFGKAAVGDPISATVDADVRQRGKTWLTKGSTISGRVRRLEKREPPESGVLIDLEFSETSQQGTRMRFNGTIAASDFVEAKTSKSAAANIARPGHFPEASTLSSPMADQFLPSEVPGVASFLVQSNPPHIPAGFKMEWKILRTKADRAKSDAKK